MTTRSSSRPSWATPSGVTSRCTSTSPSTPRATRSRARRSRKRWRADAAQPRAEEPGARIRRRGAAAPQRGARRLRVHLLARPPDAARRPCRAWSGSSWRSSGAASRARASTISGGCRPTSCTSSSSSPTSSRSRARRTRRTPRPTSRISTRSCAYVVNELGEMLQARKITVEVGELLPVHGVERARRAGHAQPDRQRRQVPRRRAGAADRDRLRPPRRPGRVLGAGQRHRDRSRPTTRRSSRCSSGSTTCTSRAPASASRS